MTPRDWCEADTLMVDVAFSKPKGIVGGKRIREEPGRCH
jgi:hypothetical protein